MIFNIKYIPGIFPNVDFSTKRRVSEYKVMPLKPNITNVMTQDRWAFVHDSVFINRIKQTVKEKRYELKFPIFESDDLSYIEQTTEAQAILEDERVLTMHNVSVNYEPAGNRRYICTVQFSIKDYDNVSSPVEHSNVNNYFLNKTAIQFTFPKRFTSNKAYAGQTPLEQNFRLYATIQNVNVKPVVGEQYYGHSAKLPSDCAVEMIGIDDNGDYVFSFISATTTASNIHDLVLDYEPETNNRSIVQNEGTYTIYTAFKGKRVPVFEDRDNIETGAGVRVQTERKTNYNLEIPFFLNDDNLDLAFALKNASSVQVGTVYAVENFEVFEYVESMINLHEFRLKLAYNIDKWSY
jgi:hypothetical protein